MAADSRNPRTAMLASCDYLRLALPEPAVLRVIGIEAKQNGTNKLSAAKIDKIIEASRKSKRHDRCG